MSIRESTRLDREYQTRDCAPGKSLICRNRSNEKQDGSNEKSTGGGSVLIVFFDRIAIVDEPVLEHGLLSKLLDAMLALNVVALQLENLFDRHFRHGHTQRLLKVDLADEEHVLAANHEQAARDVGVLSADADTFERLVKNEIT